MEIQHEQRMKTEHQRKNDGDRVSKDEQSSNGLESLLTVSKEIDLTVFIVVHEKDFDGAIQVEELRGAPMGMFLAGAGPKH
ncbi:hypothetical protein Q3G72_026635 [Acer saccharum]|nr:hypothetical protein Q3G72_026635 [Acer saccharum]